MKKHGFVLICLFFLMLGFGSIALADIHTMRFSAEMELLAGVLSQTSWVEQHGPHNGGNEYYRSLKEFFEPYQEHRAVKLAQNFTSQGFTYDAPPAFIVHLGPLPELELAHEYSSYLVKRAGGREKLEDFRAALRDLAEESQFLDFFAEWTPYLDGILAEHCEGFRQDVITKWLEGFFGWPADEFHLLVTPAMFPGGGYGATVTTADGQMHAYQIIREYGSSITKPQFPTGISLEQLTIHELGHSFVNPSLEQYPREAYSLRPLFRRVAQEMRRQAYSSVNTFLNEQVLRAVEVLAAEDLYGVEEGKRQIEYNESRSFYLTEFVVEQLRNYAENRDIYPTFRYFVPHLYDRLAQYQKENCSLLERIWGLIPVQAILN